MPKLKKILVAYDGSSHSKEALNWAIDLSLLSGAEVAAVKVFDASGLYTTLEAGVASVMKMLEEMHQEDLRLMDDVVAVGQNRGVKVAGEIIQGNVAGGIISYAKQNNVDLIIAGTKGHGDLEALLMGSVTRNLVSLAHVPVLVVKD